MKTLRDIEFYTFEDDVWYRVDGAQRRLVEGDPTVKEMFGHIEQLYPWAFAALEEIYGRSSANIPYYRFLIVRRFCKCNFGRPDPHTPDIGEDGDFHLEDVQCPLRGECRHENVICRPRFNNQISEAEMRVVTLLFHGASRREIAEELHLSELTIDNHVRNARTRVGVRNESGLIAYASKHNLIKNQ